MSNSALPLIEIAAGIAAGGRAPGGWMAMSTLSPVVLVGVTGVGKSTTLAALRAAGLAFTLLPDRRILTDRLIIACMQAEDGVPIAPVQDRTVRFAYTRRYRERFAGGMAHALTQLWVEPATAAGLLLFDGLRGANEVTHAAGLLPRSRFVMLVAPDVVRVERLLRRKDAFDTAILGGAPAEGVVHSLAELGGPGAASLFTPAEQARLLALVRGNEVTPDELRAKLQIVVEERRNYDPDATRAALLAVAPTRALVIDTTRHTADEAAALIIQNIGQ